MPACALLLWCAFIRCSKPAATPPATSCAAWARAARSRRSSSSIGPTAAGARSGCLSPLVRHGGGRCGCWTCCVLLLAAAMVGLASVASSQDHANSAAHPTSYHPSQDLRHDAARDLKDVLASHIPICPRVRPASHPELWFAWMGLWPAACGFDHALSRCHLLPPLCIAGQRVGAHRQGPGQVWGWGALHHLLRKSSIDWLV